MVQRLVVGHVGLHGDGVDSVHEGGGRAVHAARLGRPAVSILDTIRAAVPYGDIDIHSIFTGTWCPSSPIPRARLITYYLGVNLWRAVVVAVAEVLPLIWLPDYAIPRHVETQEQAVVVLCFVDVWLAFPQLRQTLGFDTRFSDYLSAQEDSRQRVEKGELSVLFFQTQTFDSPCCLVPCAPLFPRVLMQSD